MPNVCKFLKREWTRWLKGSTDIDQGSSNNFTSTDDSGPSEMSKDGMREEKNQAAESDSIREENHLEVDENHLEVLLGEMLDDVWVYFKEQEQVIAEERREIKRLENKIEENKSALNFYRKEPVLSADRTFHEVHFLKRRFRAYQRKAYVDGKLLKFRLDKIRDLKRSQSEVACLLDDLRLSLDNVNSCSSSFDMRFGLPLAPGRLLEKNRRRIGKFRNKLDKIRGTDQSVVEKFNQQLSDLANYLSDLEDDY